MWEEKSGTYFSVTLNEYNFYRSASAVKERSMPSRILLLLLLLLLFRQSSKNLNFPLLFTTLYYVLSTYYAMYTNDVNNRRGNFTKCHATQVVYDFTVCPSSFL